jgi:hypothetical protein
MSFESESQDEFNEITLVLFGEKKSSPSFFFGFRNFLKLHIESPAFSLVLSILLKSHIEASAFSLVVVADRRISLYNRRLARTEQGCN